MLRFVRDVYRITAGKDDLGARDEEISGEEMDARYVAARYSRGNVGIQEGAFVTSQDLDRERAQIAHRNFPS